MARALRTKENVDPPDSDYTFGRIRDDEGNNDGTPVNENTYGDIHQFFEKMMLDAGIVFNALPENAYSGFQFNQALSKLISGGDWTDISLINGWAHGIQHAQYRFRGTICELRGQLDGTSATLDAFCAASGLPVPRGSQGITTTYQPIVDATTPALTFCKIDTSGVGSINGHSTKIYDIYPVHYTTTIL